MDQLLSETQPCDSFSSANYFINRFFFFGNSSKHSKSPSHVDTRAATFPSDMYKTHRYKCRVKTIVHGIYKCDEIFQIE